MPFHGCCEARAIRALISSGLCKEAVQSETPCRLRDMGGRYRCFVCFAGVVGDPFSLMNIHTRSKHTRHTLPQRTAIHCTRTYPISISLGLIKSPGTPPPRSTSTHVHAPARPPASPAPLNWCGVLIIRRPPRVPATHATSATINTRLSRRAGSAILRQPAPSLRVVPLAAAAIAPSRNSTASSPSPASRLMAQVSPPLSE